MFLWTRSRTQNDIKCKTLKTWVAAHLAASQEGLNYMKLVDPIQGLQNFFGDGGGGGGASVRREAATYTQDSTNWGTWVVYVYPICQEVR
jgi:hypothetical protein